MFQRLLQPRPIPGGEPAEVDAVRAIVARLEALPPDRARHLAGFAYVLSRAAHADFVISEAETAQMEASVREAGGLDAAQAVLVVEMAKLEARRNGSTADFVITRDFAEHATYEEKLAVIRCCFLVTAAGDAISATEASIVNEIARELGVAPHDLNDVRAAFLERLSAIQAQRRLLGTE